MLFNLLKKHVKEKSVIKVVIGVLLISQSVFMTISQLVSNKVYETENEALR